jgi:hypothetical protein
MAAAARLQPQQRLGGVRVTLSLLHLAQQQELRGRPTACPHKVRPDLNRDKRSAATQGLPLEARGPGGVWVPMAEMGAAWPG